MRGDCVSSAFFKSPRPKSFIFIDKYLLDTGSPYTLIPLQDAKDINVCKTMKLVAANGSLIKTFGKCAVKIRIAGKIYEHIATVADIIHPVLGMDFLVGKGLLIDLDSRKLVQETFAEGNSVNFVSESQSSCEKSAQSLLTKFPTITDSSLSKDNVLLTPLSIDTGDAQPVYHKARPLHGEKQKQIEAEILKWESEGIVQRVRNPVAWASPVHAVKKSDGSWRVCGDFRSLNLVTKFDRYPLPSLVSFNAKMAGAKLFSKVDLRRAYHQVLVREEDRHKTTINTTVGLFEFVRMPFGLRNAGAQFQRNIHLILKDFSFLFVYMDDLLIFSNSAAQHLTHLKTLFQRLDEFGIRVNAKKCQFAQEEIEFLGHRVTQEGIEIPTSRVDAIIRYPEPKSRKELERFLGLVAFIHRFVPYISQVTTGLNALRGAKSEKEFVASWQPQHSAAFGKAKEMISSTTMLVHPQTEAKTELWTDASDTAIGSVLVQQIGSEWRPIAWWSKSFNSAQQSYSPFDKELLALSYSVHHFRDYIEGQEVVVRTDHKPLVGALHKTSNVFSPLQRRHLNRIAQYVDDVHHLPGESNILADALSRISLCPAKKNDVLPEHCPDKEVEETQLVVSQVGHSEPSMPTPEQFRVAQEQDQGLQQWVRKHSKVSSPYEPQEVLCADVPGQKVWANAATTDRSAWNCNKNQFYVGDSCVLIGQEISRAFVKKSRDFSPFPPASAPLHCRGQRQSKLVLGSGRMSLSQKKVQKRAM